MKHIILLRHAKAVSEHADGDFARPLSAHGVTQTQQVATSFRTNNWHPDLVVTSPAVRAFQTAEILGKSIDGMHIVTDRSLYLATDDRILDVLMSIPDTIQTLLLVGHNPGISDLAARWEHAYQRKTLPTAGFVSCQVPISNWSEIK